MFQRGLHAMGAAAVMLLIISCGSSSTPTSSPSPSAVSATATAHSASSPPLAATATAGAAPSDSPNGGTFGSDPLAELEPGTYRVTNPPMELTIPTSTDDMRWFGAADPAGGFVIRHATDSCDGCEAGQIAVIVTPGSVDVTVAEWTAAAGDFLSGVEPAELGSASGVRFEGVLPTELNAVIVHGGFNPHGYVAVYVLDVAGQTVVVAINQYERAGTFVDDARPVVDSFQFEA